MTEPAMPKRSMSVLCASFGVIALLETTALAVQSGDAPFNVKGRLVVVDAAGVEQSEENGTVLVSVVRDETILGMAAEGGKPSRITVIDGRFSFEIRKGERLRVDLLDLDHGQARPIANSSNDRGLFNINSATFREPWPDEIVIRARHLPIVRVHFIDAEDHSELSGVDVIRQPAPLENDVRIYGVPASTSLSVFPPPYRSMDVRLQNTASPSVLQVETESTVPFLRWSERLWCHSPGHCWTPFEVDYETGGETSVALARSGSLRVGLTGPVPEVGARLVLKPSQASDSPPARDPSRFLPEGLVDGNEPSLLDWWPVSAQYESRFDGLPSGTYRLELQAGLATGPRYLLGSVAVTIERGKESVVELDAKTVKKPTTPATFPVALDLRIDPRWTDEPFEITIQPPEAWPPPSAIRISRPQLIPKGDERDHWTTSGLTLAPGIWYLKIDRFRVLRCFEIGTGMTSVSIDVGPPVDTAFHFIDARSREPVLVRRICWSIPAPEIPGAPVRGQWSLTPRNHTLLARVPAGPIEISGVNDEIDWSDPVVVNVSPSDRDVDVPLKRLVGVRVRFTLDDVTLAWGKVYPGKPPPGGFVPPLEWGFTYPDETAMTAAKKGSTTSEPCTANLYESKLQGTSLRLPAPGTFVLNFRDPARFLPIEPLEVTIPDERVVEVVIPLHRKE